MIKRNLLLIAIIYFFLSFSYPENKVGNYFWFKIEVYKKKWSKGLEIINIENWENGTLKDFQKNLDEELKNGKILIGPFESKENVQIAYSIYSNLNNFKERNAKQLEKEYFYFSILVKKIDNNSIKIKKMGYDYVYSSNLEEFEAYLFQCLMKNQVIIGPFYLNSELNLMKFYE